MGYRCEAITTDGQPCQNPVRPGTGQCAAGHRIVWVGDVGARGMAPAAGGALCGSVLGGVLEIEELSLEAAGGEEDGATPGPGGERSGAMRGSATGSFWHRQDDLVIAAWLTEEERDLVREHYRRATLDTLQKQVPRRVH